MKGVTFILTPRNYNELVARASEEARLALERGGGVLYKNAEDITGWDQIYVPEYWDKETQSWVFEHFSIEAVAPEESELESIHA